MADYGVPPNPPYDCLIFATDCINIALQRNINSQLRIQFL